MKSLFIFTLSVVAMVATACESHAQAFDQYGRAYASTVPFSPIRSMGLHPQARRERWAQYQQQAANAYYSSIRSTSAYDRAADAPAFAYGSYGYGAPVYGGRYIMNDFRKHLEDRIEKHENTVENRLDQLEDRIEDAPEDEQPHVKQIRNYREYREHYRKEQREDWENWRKRFSKE